VREISLKEDTKDKMEKMHSNGNGRDQRVLIIEATEEEED
jgi:hypothetical protein